MAKEDPPQDESGKEGHDMRLDINESSESSTGDGKENCSVDSLNTLDVADDTSKQTGRSEFFPIGKFNKPPSKEDPVFYETNHPAEGQPVTVGPFNLSSNDIRRWAQKTGTNTLNELVDRDEIRPSTALTVKSQQFCHILDLMDSKQRPTKEMIQRFLPGDLQRAIARDIIEDQRKKGGTVQ